MAKRVQIVRHDTSGLAIFTGLVGEITVNTTKKTIVVHDGATAGGQEMAKEDLSSTPNATNTTAGRMSAAQVTQLETNTTDIAAAQADIITNATDITTNTSNISTNAADIAVNAAAIAANASGISTNASEISTNAANIATNTSDITTLQSGKANKIGTPTNNRIVAMDAGGDIKDSGESLTDIHSAANLTGTAPAGVLPAATTSAQGAVELATQTEVNTGTDTTKAITPSTLKNLTAPAISGFTAGRHFYMADVQDSAAFDVDAVIGASWESIGPTGSGATNIWTELDAIPANAVSVTVRSSNFATTSTSGNVAASRTYARKGGGAETNSIANLIGIASVKNSSGLAEQDESIAESTILLDSSNRFEVLLSANGTVSSELRFVGFTTK